MNSEAYTVKSCPRASTVFLIVAFVCFSTYHTLGCTVNIIARKRDQMNIQANDVVKYDLLRIAGGLLSCVLHV